MKAKEKIAFTDLDAEKEVISLITSNPQAYKQVQKIINPDIFYFTQTRNVFLACGELFSEKGSYTMTDVILRLKSNGSEDWATLLASATSHSSSSTNELLVYLAELKGKRDLMTLSKQITNDLANGVDYFTLVDKVNSLTNKEMFKDDDKEVIDMKSALLDAVNNLGDIMTNGITAGVPTGYPKLDMITGGWLKGNVILFAARPGQGKTICLLEHARNAASMGHKVLFLSLEMPVLSLIYRMISGSLDESTPYSKIKTGRININQFTTIQREAVTKLEKLPITWYDGANRDINYLVPLIQKIVREKGIEMVCIDYLQLMGDYKISSSNENALVGSVSDKIQMLSKALNIPFLCAAQLNRGTEGRTNHRPRLSDLRSSGKIEQNASVVIGLYRADYYAYEEAKEIGNPNVEYDNTIEYIFLKNRDGQTATHEMFIDVATSKIKEHNFVGNNF